MRTIGVDTIKRYVEFLIDKSMSGGVFSPDDLNISLPIVLNKLISKYYGSAEQYRPHDPTPAISYEITQLVTDYIGHLKEDKILSVDSMGRMVEPTDYLHKSSISVSAATVEDWDELAKCCDDTVQTTAKKSKKRIKTYWTPVTVISDNEFAAWTSSTLRYPDLEYPICRKFKNYWEFLPLNIRSVRFIYLRYPATPIWNYTNPSGTMPIYNPTGSVDIELPEILADEFAMTILSRLGFSIREDGAVSYSKFIKETGE